VSRSPAEDRQLRELVLLRRVRDRIDREYHRPLDVEALARGVHLSAGHLSREFRRAYGESPYSYLMTRRIERAMALLRRGELSVTEVCFAVGCSSLGTFTTRFTELVGMPPGAYRRAARDEDGTAATGGQGGTTAVTGGAGGTAAGPEPAARTLAEGARAAGLSTEGMPACVAGQVTRPVRNREVPASPPPLA
jgi:AraC-like DNA-binding protein